MFNKDNEIVSKSKKQPIKHEILLTNFNSCQNVDNTFLTIMGKSVFIIYLQLKNLLSCIKNILHTLL